MNSGRGPSAGGRGGAAGGRGGAPQQGFGTQSQGGNKGGNGLLRGGKKAGWGNNKRMDRKQDRVPSLAVGGEWEMIEEFDLAQLLKLAANIPKVEDLLVCGHLDQYDENYDKLTTRTEKKLKRVENKFFCDVTTSEDPVLERLAVEQVGDVYATDAILAQLMAAPRSVYSWDIVIEKVQGIIFLDKRENSTFDLLSVSETAHEPPTATEDFEEINHPEKLSLEATMINQNFSQQVLMEMDGVRKTVSDFFLLLECMIHMCCTARKSACICYVILRCKSLHLLECSA